MRVEILGPVRVVADDGSVCRLEGPRLRTLLAALALRSNRPCDLSRLVEILWDGGAVPDGAQATVRAHVMRLRRALGAAGPRIVTCPPGYLIELAEHELDLTEFLARRRVLDEAARTHAWTEARASAEHALKLWRGEPLADVPSDTLRSQELPRLEELRLETVELGIEAGLHLGHGHQLVAQLRELTERHPLREHLHVQLVRALAASGRRAEALAAYRHARSVLIEELGIEPGPELREAHDRVLKGEDTPAPALRDTSSTPRQLPAAVRHFTGRTEELTVLSHLPDEAAAAGSVAICVISGTAGVGKTALAVHWAHRQTDRFPDGQLYVNLRGYDPAQAPLDAAATVPRLLAALDVRPDRVPADLQAQIDLYRSLMAHRRVLVVLDNARDADQVRPLLPGASGCLVLVTSRARLTGLVAVEGAVPVTLGVFGRDEARELLVRRLGTKRVEARPQAADELVDLCAGLPLALNIAAAHAEFQPGSTLDALVGRLREVDRRLDAFNAGDPAVDVRAVFTWSYQSLGADVARVFRLLGLHPGADFTEQAAQSLSGLSVVETRRALAELTASNLLTEHGSGRYALHDLLREYAREQCDSTETDMERRECVRRALTWYLGGAKAAAELISATRLPSETDHPPGSAPPPDFYDQTEAMAWCAAEQANLVACVVDAIDREIDDYGWQLAIAAQPYYNHVCLWDDWRTTHQQALIGARRLGDKEAEGRLLSTLGQLCLRTHEIDTGVDHLNRAAALMREIGNRAGEVAAMSRLGNAHMMLGQWEQAADRFREVASATRELGDRRSEGILTTNLGACLTYLGRHDEAEEVTLVANKITRETGSLDALASGLSSLRMIALARGDIPAAFAYADECIRLCRETGNRFNEAWVLNGLADVHLAAGDPDSAIAALTASTAIFTDLDPDQAAEQRAQIARLRAGHDPERA